MDTHAVPVYTTLFIYEGLESGPPTTRGRATPPSQLPRPKRADNLDSHN
ncbi:unnamed protein product [Rhodiola kirilowii]